MLSDKSIFIITCSLMFVALCPNCSPKQNFSKIETSQLDTTSSSGGMTSSPQGGTQNGSIGTIANPNPHLPAPVLYKSCTLNDGSTVPNLWFSWGLKNNSSNPLMCDLFEQRQCFDGTLPPSSGNFNQTTCSVPAVARTTITTPCVVDGRVIDHNDIAIIYRNKVENNESCIGEIRRCVSGNFTGDKSYASFTCGQASYRPASGTIYDCTFNGNTIPDGSSQIAFKAQNPAGNCEFEPRLCTQGRLSGSFAYNSCHKK